MLIGDIIGALRQYAPEALQEDYDNTGIQIGTPDAECTGVLLCLDVTPATVAEASERGCNLLVSHHPLLFKGLKRITGATTVELSVSLAIKHDITIYSLHTAIDNAPGGVSWAMAQRLGLVDTATLDPVSHKLLKLTVFVPTTHTDTVAQALFNAGCGKLGNYDSCSFGVKGQGSFRPLDGSHSYVGSADKLHFETETRLEVLLPSWLMGAAEQALRRAHPYECPAYEFVRLENQAPGYGSGVVGTLPQPLSARELVDRVKATFGSPIVRATKPPLHPITKVALCGGSGSFLINKAIAAGARAFITSDTSYHNFVDYADKIFILDIGHFESEHCTEEIFYRIIREKFPTFAVYYSQAEQNPIFYL